MGEIVFFQLRNDVLIEMWHSKYGKLHIILLSAHIYVT